MKPNLAIGGTIKDAEQETIFLGRWFKPWTWGNWQRVTVIKRFDFHSISLVRGGGEPMKRKEGDQ